MDTSLTSKTNLIDVGRDILFCRWLHIVAMREGTTFSYFLPDNLGLRSVHTRTASVRGAVVGVTDSGGTLVSESRYLPLADFAPPNAFCERGGETRTDVGTITQTDFGYTFQRNIMDTGLIRERTVDMWTTMPALREAPLWGTTLPLDDLSNRIR